MKKIITVALLCFAAISLWADPQFSFTTAGELNQYIESRWSVKNDYPALYALALEGVRRFPDNAETLGCAAWLEFVQRAGDWGVQKMLDAYARNPGHEYIRIWALNIFYNAGINCADPALGISLLAKTMELKPESAGDCLNFIGMRHMWKDNPDYQAALEALNRAEAAGNKSENLYANRANAYKKLNRIDEAILDIKRALAINPQNSWALHIYAWIRYDQREYGEWADSLEKFLAIPDSDFVKQQTLNTHYYLGLNYLPKLGKLSKAHEHLAWLVANAADDKDAPTWNKSIGWLESKIITVTCELNLDEPPADGRVLVLLPVQNSTQTHQGYSFDPEPKRYEIERYKGNTYARLYYNTTPARITAATQILRTPASLEEGGFQFNDPADDPQDYAGSVDYGWGIIYQAGNARLAALAASIVGKETDVLKKARLINTWVDTHFTYQVIFHNNLDTYFDTGLAECGGYALVFVSLCRAAGIPARRIYSPYFQTPDDATLGSHETSEFFVAGKGWIPVNNVEAALGCTMEVLILWCGETADYAPGALAPDLEKITARYIDHSGKVVELYGR
jgi:tetratricopeptide (TPR) repeat protein